MITIGIFVASAINSIIIKTTSGDFMWRACLAAQVIPGLLLFLLTITIPYSPRWLADNDRDDEAIAILARLREKNVNSQAVIEEYRAIKDNIEYERQIGTASYAELLIPGIINRVVMAMYLLHLTN
jgi:MFS family permease